MDCIIYLSPPNIKQTFDLHHVVYLTHIYLIVTKFYPTFGYLNLNIKQRLSPTKESSDYNQLLAYSFRLLNNFPLQNYYHMLLTFMVNTRKGKIITQQQTEMNPPNPPPVEIDQVVAAQRLVIQQLTDLVTEMQNQIRQEREEIRQVRQEIRQARLERQQQQQPPPPPPAPPSYINIYINYYYL